MKSDHFKGKEAQEHLKDARFKGAQATQETHGIEASGFWIAWTDSFKESAIVLTGVWMLLSFLPCHRPYLFLLIFSSGYLIWRTGRSALLGYSRLERLHRLIEEERWEIEHHRAQEKEELRAMYEQKGFTGELLDQVVEVLVADDNRLLRVMLEEELGLTLESFEHPLKQAFGAAIGTFLSCLAAFGGAYFGGFWGLLGILALLYIWAALFAAKKERNNYLKALVWNCAVACLVFGLFYLVSGILL